MPARRITSVTVGISIVADNIDMRSLAQLCGFESLVMTAFAIHHSNIHLSLLLTSEMGEDIVVQLARTALCHDKYLTAAQHLVVRHGPHNAQGSTASTQDEDMVSEQRTRQQTAASAHIMEYVIERSLHCCMAVIKVLLCYSDLIPN